MERLNLLDAIDQGVCLLDAKQRLAYANVGASLLIGQPLADLPGKALREMLFSPQHSLDELLQHAEAEGQWSGLLHCRNRPLKARLRPFRTEESASTPGATRYLLTLLDYAEEWSTQQALAEARTEAERMQSTRAKFLAHMTHELRTPLNAIAGFSQLLEAGDELNAEQREHVQEIRSAGERLLTLIDEILESSRVEPARLQLQPERVDLGALVDECCALYAPWAAQRQIRLLARGDGSLHCDRARLKQVLLNLLGNAIKYNRPQGEVLTQILSPAPGLLRLEVHDSGRGIAAPLLKHLFRPFESLLCAASGQRACGLGLLIARHLVELLGGRIDVLSETGAGSLFRVELPLDVTAPASEAQGAGGAGNALAPGDPLRALLCLDDREQTRELLRRYQSLDRPLRLLSREDAADADFILEAQGSPREGGLCLRRRLKPAGSAAVIDCVAGLVPDAGAGARVAFGWPVNFFDFTRCLDALILVGRERGQELARAC